MVDEDAECTVRAEVVRHQTIMKVNCLVSGFVVTQCDRCLEDLVLKVNSGQLNFTQ